MSDKKIPTNEFLNKLLKTSSINRFIKRYNEDMDLYPVFHDYISQLCVQKGVSRDRIIKKADISKTYGYQIFNGERNPSRDRVIQLAFSFEMNYDETQELLRVARKTALYPKITRDAVIIHALNHGYDVASVQEALYELSVTILGEDR
ncbi:MAG: helix-turn-helix domain-containing protein [Oscillospiraceae bacterium]|nr:helix-turn-helix domain-containing protein [Oscillospiraceae bacterium]